MLADESGFLDSVLPLLDDLDVAIALDQRSLAQDVLRRRYQVEEFPHSLNVLEAGSDLRVQIQTDPRYGAFVEHADVRSVLGKDVPDVRIEDVLQGKVWAASDAGRRPSKRLKDFADIARILESRPELATLVPAEIRERLT